MKINSYLYFYLIWSWFSRLTSYVETLSVGSFPAGYVRCDVLLTCMSALLATWLIKVKGTWNQERYTTSVGFFCLAYVRNIWGIGWSAVTRDFTFFFLPLPSCLFSLVLSCKISPAAFNTKLQARWPPSFVSFCYHFSTPFTLKHWKWLFLAAIPCLRLSDGSSYRLCVPSSFKAPEMTLRVVRSLANTMAHGNMLVQTKENAVKDMETNCFGGSSSCFPPTSFSKILLAHWLDW